MTGAAQNKLGELFVDIGVGGVGKTLKSLNSISASFLLTKNAAMQAVKPFIDMGKHAVNTAVDIAKMGASLGSTRVEAQKLIWYLRKNNLSESLVGDLSSLSQIFTRLKGGLGGLDDQMSTSMGMLGLDWQNYSGDINSIFQYVKDVQNAIKRQNLDAATAKMHLANLGLGSADWFYALQKGDFDLSESKTYSDKVAQALIDFKEKENQRVLQGEINSALLTANILNAGGANVQNAVNKVYEDVGTLLGEDENAKAKVKQRYATYANTGKKLYNPSTYMLFGFELLKEMNKRKIGSYNPLESVPQSELTAAGDISNGALPSLTNTAGQPLQVNVNTEVKSKDPESTEFTVLDINVEPIQYTQAMQRNSN